MKSYRSLSLGSVLTILLASFVTNTLPAQGQPASKPLSHPASRNVPTLSRPMDKGPALFVDAAKGSEQQDGSQQTPWRSVNHAVKQLKDGELGDPRHHSAVGFSQ